MYVISYGDPAILNGNYENKSILMQGRRSSKCDNCRDYCEDGVCNWDCPYDCRSDCRWEDCGPFCPCDYDDCDMDEPWFD